MDLNRSFEAIPYHFNNHGYYTAVCGDYAADVFSRIELGFSRVDAPFFNADSILQQAMLDAHAGLIPFITNRAGLALFPVLQDSAYFCPPALVVPRIKRAVAEAGDRPFFIVTFFSSTHFPYAPPYPYYSMFADAGYDGPYRYLKQKIISIGDQAQEERISSEDIAQVRALYDGGIRAFDDQVGVLLEWLKQQGRLDNTIIVVTSDHGENLYEPGMGMGHGEHFRGGLATRSPFVVYWPKRFARRTDVHQLVRQVDIAPTLLELCSIDIPPTVEGRSLVPMIVRPDRDEHRMAFGETGIWFDTAPARICSFRNSGSCTPILPEFPASISVFANRLCSISVTVISSMSPSTAMPSRTVCG
jgi:hypothetical protein